VEGPGVHFDRGTAFQQVLRQRVTAHFARTGRRERGGWELHLKTVVLLGGFAAAYGLLVFVARGAAQAVPLAIVLGLIAAGIGLNIQHDAGHRAYSDRPWVNRLMALTLELIGGSAYLWRWKHGAFHHAHVNLAGHDPDIDLGILGRLSPHQPRRAFHRWQHVYLWALYGLLVVKWQLVGDFQRLVAGRMRTRSFPRPRGWDLVTFVAGKLVFFAMAFAVPLQFHALGAVLACYALAAVVAGGLLSVVFQVGHCVEEAAFPVPDGETGRVDRPWAIHQVESSADFARGSRVVAWLAGGLNFQIEHHLFPRISHVHYPALAAIVEQTCREYGVRYTAFGSFRAAVRSHGRWLRRMGMPDPAG
jgi:linoleoyl-CoA desaturase